MSVVLLYHTPEPERAIAAAARVQAITSNRSATWISRTSQASLYSST